MKPAIRILNGQLEFYHDCTDDQLSDTFEERYNRMNKIIYSLRRNMQEDNDIER